MPRRRMPNEKPPAKPRRPRAPTRPVSLRMDVELWERLEHHAPLQRRSVTNLLQWLVADGLDRLDAAEGAKVPTPRPINPPPSRGMIRRRKPKRT